MSNLYRARFLVKFCVVPERVKVIAPKLLSGQFSLNAVSAEGARLVEAAREE